MQPSRKLSVILHADVVDSTWLVQENETTSHQRIHAAFNRLSETISAYGGTARELRGDALVAEFMRTSDAICAALAFQRDNTAINAMLNDNIRPELRIGISLGEVIVADGTMTGSGVVMAQRLEQLAETGGVCVQSAVYETVPKRLPFEFKNLGDQQLKGFQEPVRTYTVVLRTGEDVPSPEPVVDSSERAIGQLPHTALEDKPSILIMPFVNDSGDREQDFFAKGITDNIIILLTRFRDLFVFAYKTSMATDGNINSPGDAHSELGTNYVVEGSVRRAKERIRITARLVDARDGRLVWARNYDREASDLITIQDEIADLIVHSLVDTVDKEDKKRIYKKPIEALACYELVLKGQVLLNDYTRESELAARECFRKAVELDPDYAPAYSGLAVSHDHEYHSTWCDDPETANRKVLEYATRALELDENNIMGLYALADAFYARGEHERALIEINRAIEINPNDYHNVCSKGAYLTYSGQIDEGIQCSVEAMRTNPYAADNCLEVIGTGEYLREEYERALLAFCKMKRNSLLKLGGIAACYAQLGRTDEAAHMCKDFLSVTGGSDEEIKNWKNYWTRTSRLKNTTDRDKILVGMQKAGIPVMIDSQDQVP